MTPWEIVEHLANSDKPDEILSTLSEGDPFWIGASYAIDPFVGIIVRLPLRRDPNQYGAGVNPITFDKLAKSIIDGHLTGDKLILTVEALSRACREDEWVFWYKRILQGDMDIPVSLEIFNKFCPDNYRIPPPALSKPKGLLSITDIPKRFCLQPIYPFERVFWLIDSRHQPMEIRCYNSSIRRVRDLDVEELIAAFGMSKPMDIVLMGYMTRGGFIADDILTREQFTAEAGGFPLHKRLAGLNHFGIPLAQVSPPINSSDTDGFYKELGLILEQGYKGAILRDLDANYPFHKQPDFTILPSVKGTVICTEVIEAVGLRTKSTRGDKTITSIVRLGLTASINKYILESNPIGQRLDVLSCGQKDNELLFPVFQRWKE